MPHHKVPLQRLLADGQDGDIKTFIGRANGSSSHQLQLNAREALPKNRQVADQLVGGKRWRAQDTQVPARRAVDCACKFVRIIKYSYDFSRLGSPEAAKGQV